MVICEKTLVPLHAGRMFSACRVPQLLASPVPLQTTCVLCASVQVPLFFLGGEVRVLQEASYARLLFGEDPSRG